MSFSLCWEKNTRYRYCISYKKESTVYCSEKQPEWKHLNTVDWPSPIGSDQLKLHVYVFF